MFVCPSYFLFKRQIFIISLDFFPPLSSLFCSRLLFGFGGKDLFVWAASAVARRDCVPQNLCQAGTQRSSVTLKERAPL